MFLCYNYQNANQKDFEMKQNEIKVLEEERATLSRAIADEIKKRDSFIAEQNIIIEDLYAQYEMADAKLTAALREQEQKERKFNEPALYRQAEIKAEAEKLKKNQQPIDVNDKNIPAVIRQQAKKAGVDIVALKKELSR